jgi:hypothetical protein
MVELTVESLTEGVVVAGTEKFLCNNLRIRSQKVFRDLQLGLILASTSGGPHVIRT